jgi:leucyl-tRNA synthetase
MLRCTVYMRERQHLCRSSSFHPLQVNPDDVVTQFGADSLRLYEMFMGPLRDTKVSEDRSSLRSSKAEGVNEFCP